MTCILLSKFPTAFKQKGLLQFITVVILASFLIKPIKELKENISNKTAIYEAAEALKRNGITGNFFGSNTDYKDGARNYFFCYLTNSRLFGIFTTVYTDEEILDAARKYQVKYFFNYYQSAAEKEYILKSSLASNSVKVYDSVYPGMIIFQLIK